VEFAKKILENFESSAHDIIGLKVLATIQIKMPERPHENMPRGQIPKGEHLDLRCLCPVLNPKPLRKITILLFSLCY